MNCDMFVPVYFRWLDRAICRNTKAEFVYILLTYRSTGVR